MLHYCLLNFFGQDDLWDAMEEYKEAKEMMLDIGRQILLKVYPKQIKLKIKILLHFKGPFNTTNIFYPCLKLIVCKGNLFGSIIDS